MTLTLEQASQWLGVLSGLVLVASLLITVLVFALRRAKQQQENAAADRVIELAKEEMELLRQRASRVPELEDQLKVLREEVGAGKAIAALDAKTEGAFGKMAATLDGMERRAQRADQWQARFNRATIEGLNRLLAHAHEPAVQVDNSGERT